MSDQAYDRAEAELEKEAFNRKVETLKAGIKGAKRLNKLLIEVQAKIREVESTPAQELEHVQWPDFRLIQ